MDINQVKEGMLLLRVDLNHPRGIIKVGDVITVDKVKGATFTDKNWRLAHEPKNYIKYILPDVRFGEMPPEDKVLLVTAGINGHTIQRKSRKNGQWEDKCQYSSGVDSMIFKKDTFYRIKPKISPQEIRIAELEFQIEKLKLEQEALRKEL